MKLEKFNPLEETFKIGDADFTVSALSGAQRLQRDMAPAPSRPFTTILCGLKSIKNLFDHEGKPIDTAEKFLTALDTAASGPIARLAKKIAEKIDAKTDMPKEAAKN